MQARGQSSAIVRRSVVTRNHDGIALDGVDSPRDAAHRGARVASPGRLGRLCDATESQNRNSTTTPQLQTYTEERIGSDAQSGNAAKIIH